MIICRDTTQNIFHICSLINFCRWLILSSQYLSISLITAEMWNHHLSHVLLSEMFKLFFSPHFSALQTPSPVIPVVTRIKSSLPLLVSQQPYAPPPHPMAPPSPSTNSCSQGGAEQLSKTNLYIRGLPPGTTDQDLIKLCQPWVLTTATVTLCWHMCRCHDGVPLAMVWCMLI